MKTPRRASSCHTPHDRAMVRKSLGMLALALLGWVASGLGTGCATLGSVAPYPSAHVAGVTLQDVDFTAVTLRFEIDVTNPYSVDLPIVGLDYVLSSEDRQFLDGRVDVERAIPAGATGAVLVPVRVPFLSLYNVVGSVRPGSDVPYRADLGLRLQAPVVGPLRLPLERSGTIPIPSLR